MNKKNIAGIIICLIGIFFLIGAIRALPDLKPLGASVALLVCGLIIAVSGFLNKSWNVKMYVGTILMVIGLIAIFGTISYFPDYRPFGAMIVLFLAGAIALFLGFTRAKITIPSKKKKTLFGLKISPFNLFASLVTLALFVISLLLLPKIDWQHPGDPAGVMILTALIALGVIYVLAKNHPAKKPVVYAGLIAVANFALIPLYESGALDFIGKFYRLFIPLYSKFDPWAQTIEYTLIAITIILAIIFIIKKVKISDYGKITLIYFLIMPLMAIFLFEMMGLPAGFLAGDTTRSDMLVTDTNAAIGTFGILFIAVTMYISFELFPFWVTPILAGIWWVFWKPWLLHHPNPALFTSFSSFLPAALFLFFTGLKRIVLPMILLVFAINLIKHKKLFKATSK